MYIGAGVKGDFYMNVQFTMCWLLFFFFIAVTKHLTNHYEGGEADGDSWIQRVTVHHSREDRQNCLVLGGGLGTDGLCT